MTSTRTALVIGGGIAGPVAAMALRKAGIDATVFEAYAQTADGVGGALSIAPNGQLALDVIDAGEIVRAVGVPMRGMVMQSWTGKVLGEFGSADSGPLADLPDMQLVWRGDLYAALYAEAARRGIRIEHGRRLVGLTETADGVTARFADGTTATADILIGADGIRSAVRGLIDPAAPSPRYAGLLGFGAQVAATGLPSTQDKMHMVFGKRAFFGYQVSDDGDGGWFVNLPHKEPMSRTEAMRVPNDEWLRRLAAQFTEDRVPAREMIGRTRPEDLVITGGLEDIPHVPVWHRGRVCLIGDAAHPTSPSSGQGASLAVESGVELARCLRDLPYDQAFAAYEGQRRARVERVIAMAARTNSDKAAGPVARVIRDLVMPVAMKMMKPEKMAWQFAYRIDWDAPVRPELVAAA
ncbi:FAD-dependent oxidoreductase [Hamadaea tsunoensis]|uniref:FAD-dependent oxidoreductase n=1 Tax=Hamadaea tsunoensis TaxID=53368 RepID=UPI0004296AB2|nr:NAD(P)/FAD-dependent oxidoreductase [Hamadaea tsunoensis]